VVFAALKRGTLTDMSFGLSATDVLKLVQFSSRIYIAFKGKLV
jgi:hypothetical protein